MATHVEAHKQRGVARIARHTEGAISAISLARTGGIPFLGTCAGFQHAMIEYFRNVIGTADAAHAELNPEAEHPLISKLSCSLVEVIGTIRLTSGSLSQRLYGTDRVEEGYHCSYGLNPDFAQLIRDRDDLPGDPFPTGALFSEGSGSSAYPRICVRQCRPPLTARAISAIQVR